MCSSHRCEKKCNCDCKCDTEFDKCIGGICLRVCSHNSDCFQFGMICSSESNFCTVPACHSSDDCQGSKTCFDYKCIDNNICETSEECQSSGSTTIYSSAGYVMTKISCFKGACRFDCSHHDDCPQGYGCVNRYCEKRECNFDWDCDTRECIEGQCKRIICKTSGMCPANMYCHENLCQVLPGCSKDSSCPLGLKCRNSECAKTCESFRDCNFGHSCQDNVCVSYKCSKACLLCKDGLCYDNCLTNDKLYCDEMLPGPSNECPDGKAEYLGQCVQVNCKKNSHCPGDLVCSQNICIESSCYEDTDCKGGFICQAKKCKPAQRCQAHEQCQPGYFCRPERGYKICTKNGYSCKRHSQCLQNEYCNCQGGNKCVCTEISVQRQCLYDSDCLYNYECNLSEGVCQPQIACSEKCPLKGYQCDHIQKKCYQPATFCPDGYELDKSSKLCLIKGSSKACKLTPYLSEFKNERCQPFSCAVKKCPSGFVCSSQKLCFRESKITISITTYCNSDFDCIYGKECKLGQCFRRCSGKTCDSGKYCNKHGFCTEDKKNCKAGHEFEDEFCILTKECYINNDCPFGRECKNNKCIRISARKQCIYDSDCKGNKICWDERCYQSCRNSQTCPHRHHCSKVRGTQICIPTIPSGEKGCPYKGMVVVNSRCVFLECYSSEDCLDGTSCFQGKCMNVQSCRNNECKSNNECIMGVCIDKQYKCNRDADCLSFGDAFCDYGICTSKIYLGCPVGMRLNRYGYCSNSVCYSDNDCLENNRCSNPNPIGLCLPENTVVVTVTNKCREGQHIINGACEDIECKDDSYCKLTELCILGFCLKRVARCNYQR